MASALDATRRSTRMSTGTFAILRYVKRESFAKGCFYFRLHNPKIMALSKVGYRVYSYSQYELPTVLLPKVFEQESKIGLSIFGTVCRTLNLHVYWQSGEWAPPPHIPPTLAPTCSERKCSARLILGFYAARRLL